MTVTFYNLGISSFEVVDVVGSALFGRALRLRLLLWVAAQTDAFFQQQAAEGVAYSQSAVAKELATIEALEMIIRYSRPTNTGRQYYRRVESPYWRIVEAARQAVASRHGESPSSHRSS